MNITIVEINHELGPGRRRGCESDDIKMLGEELRERINKEGSDKNKNVL